MDGSVFANANQFKGIGSACLTDRLTDCQNDEITLLDDAGFE
jgi:hypothetical protein